MGCDSLRLINMTLALLIQSFSQQKTTDFVNQNINNGKIDGREYSIQRLVDIKLNLFYDLCLLDDSVPYPYTPYDTISFDSLISNIDLSGGDVNGTYDELMFVILEVDDVIKLLEVYQNANDSPPNFNKEEVVQQIEEMISFCKENSEYKIAYFFNF